MWPFKCKPAEPYHYSFVPGDLVRLKSGGPTMTVRHEVNADACYYTGVSMGVHCSWYDGRFLHDVFYPAQLEKAQPKQQEAN